MATQPVSFYVPNVVVTISDRDVEHLLDRLRSVGNPNAPGRDCAGAHQLIDAARQVPPATDVPLKLDGGRLDAVLRALDHLHSTSLFSRSLTRLRDTLISTSGPPTWTAEVQLGYGAKLSARRYTATRGRTFSMISSRPIQRVRTGASLTSETPAGVR